MNAYKKIDDNRFKHYILRDKKDVYEALKWFFKKGEEAVAY
jgi:uncharacterized sporulation protein YeaH/YhbH (DUF444 family)